MDIGWEAGVLALARRADVHADRGWDMFSALPGAPVVAQKRRGRGRRRRAHVKTRRA